MKRAIFPVGFHAAFAISAVTLSAAFIIGVIALPERYPEDAYVWARATAAGAGCWPDCAPGQWCWPTACDRQGEWPMGVVPLAAFDRLWMISNTASWSSADGLRWTRVRSNAGWGERYGMPGVFFKNRLWKLGGMEKSWDNFRNDVWSSSDGADWKLATPHAGWGPRRGHAVVVFDDRLWVLGGMESSGRADRLPTRGLSDVWSSADGINWTRATDNAPWSGGNNAVVFQGRIWVIGGGAAWHSGDGRTWTNAVADADWLARGGIGAAGCLVFDGKIWVFGGIGREGTLNDVWSSSDGIRWRRAAAHAPWTPRGAEHSAVFNQRLWIYGGKTGRADVENGFGGDVWHLAPRGGGRPGE